MTKKALSTSTANPLVKENEVLAICYFNSDDDDQNRCILTKEELIIYRNSKEFRVMNSDLTSLSIGKSKHLFYVIIGGIIAPLSLLAIYDHLFSTSLLLIIALSAIGLFYYGLSGTDALLIKNKKNDYLIQLDNVNEGLSNFMIFVNAIAPQLNNPLVVYYAIRTKELKYQLFTPEEFNKTDPPDDFVIIDFLKLKKEITIKPVSNGFGLFVSEINEDSIIKQEE